MSSETKMKVGVSKGTIVRTILLFITLLNMILQHFGIDVINVDENQLLSWIEMIVSFLTIISTWWYNNSFSKKAQKADNYLKRLKNAGYDEDVPLDEVDFSSNDDGM